MVYPAYARVPEIADRARPGLAEELENMWKTPPGPRGWLSSVDHKEIGLRYLVTAFIFLFAGGIQALIMRLQLAHGGMQLLTPEQYNELFTMHGITMILLYAFPVLSGFSNFLWPLLLGSRDMALPRLNAFPIGYFWHRAFSSMRASPSVPRPTPAGSIMFPTPAANSTQASTSIFMHWETSFSVFRRRRARSILSSRHGARGARGCRSTASRW